MTVFHLFPQIHTRITYLVKPKARFHYYNINICYLKSFLFHERYLSPSVWNDWVIFRGYKNERVWAKKRNNSQLKKGNQRLTLPSIDWWLPWYTFNVTQPAFCWFFLSMIDIQRLHPKVQGDSPSYAVSNKIY